MTTRRQSTIADGRPTHGTLCRCLPGIGTAHGISASTARKMDTPSSTITGRTSRHFDTLPDYEPQQADALPSVPEQWTRAHRARHPGRQVVQGV